MTGIFDCSTTARMSDSPPRGMHRSMRLSSWRRCFTASRLVVLMSCMVFGSRADSLSACWMMFAMAVFECSASLPPRRMVALPAFRQSAAASAVTFGLDSKMMRIEPMGTVIFCRLMPLGRIEPCNDLPKGLGCWAICVTASAMLWMADWVSVRRSIMAGDRLYLGAFSRSFLFSWMMRSAEEEIALAILCRALLRCNAEDVRNLAEAAWAFCAVVRQ